MTTNHINIWKKNVKRRKSTMHFFIWLNVTVSLIALLYLGGVTAACPSPCVCKWKNGKQFVECSDEKLTFIPTGMDPETQVLDFSGNNLQVLQKERFKKLDLINLQKIYLSRCELHKIDNQAFKGLSNLVDLDLSQNYLTIIPSTNFIEFPSLMRLILNDNPITAVRTHAFQHLTFLNTLEISNCEINTIEDEAFTGLNHLEWLKLDGNKLSTIQGVSILPETLHGVDLQNNLWHCDCQLQDLHNWLTNFNIPHSVEPICKEPKRLKGKPILALTDVDLACLPEISPTMLYLEINEGKNISLQCQVTAIPEAKISWWFQGQILQNDSIIAPGIHLYYFLEEGTLDKKSELFIYNTNAEDNGTFSCVAENPAGKAQSNYTIRIIVKKEPIVIVVTFPYEYIIILACGVSVVVLIVIVIAIITVLKCKKNSRRRKKKESSKDVALQNTNNSSKSSSLPDSSEHLPPKINGSLIINTQAHHVMHYPIAATRDVTLNMGGEPFYNSNSLRSYQTEKNPDIINDAEIIGKKRELDGNKNSRLESTAESMDEFDENKLMSLPPSIPRQVKWQDQQKYINGMATLPRGTSRDMYQHSADVHVLSPGCFLDSEGYPVDYGLPKMSYNPTPHSAINMSTPYYQTLPHNRTKLRKLPIQYSNDNEFLVRPCQAYEPYNPPDIRYTAEGYPFAKNRNQTSLGPSNYSDANFVPSPPEGYKSGPMSPSSLLCCTNAATSSANQWTHPSSSGCNLNGPQNLTNLLSDVGCFHIQTRCVPTQTNEPDGRQDNFDMNCSKAMPQVAHVKTEPENCTESPDEGYVGDGVEATDI